MKILKKLVAPFLTVAVFVDAAFAEVAGESRTFRFDNGNGLSGTSTHSTFTSRHGAFLPENGTPVSRFFVHRELGTGTLHYGGTASEDEHHYYGGVSLGDATLAYFPGEGEKFSKSPNDLYEGLNQYFFHGGSRSPFELRGVAADIGLAGGVSARFAATDVTAPNVADRRGFYTGIANRHVEAGVFRLERGNEKVGRGLNLAFRSDRLDLEYQELRSEYDAHVRRLALAWDATPAGRLSLEFEQSRNDLFSRDDEQRIMLRFRKSLGRPPAFNAAGNGNGGEDDEAEEPGFNKAVGIGLGLGIAAVALSSGSGSDGADRFANRNRAAFAILNRINPVSVRQNREHGGWLYRNADNTFAVTQPVRGTVNSVNIGNPFTVVPMGTIASASYHTHGGPDPRFDNENFSPVDIRADRIVGLDGYLGTPAGFMKLHDVETGNITVVGRIAN